MGEEGEVREDHGEEDVDPCRGLVQELPGRVCDIPQLLQEPAVRGQARLCLLAPPSEGLVLSRGLPVRFRLRLDDLELPEQGEEGRRQWSVRMVAPQLRC